MARSPATLSDLSVLQGFSSASAFSSTTRIFWNSRKRKGNVEEEEEGKAPQGIDGELEETKAAAATTDSLVSQRRKALFEPLPNLKTSNGPRPESLLLLPPPDFDEAVVYPKGWLVGKKRKLVNVDVVESMRRIAIQEMNRKDREISGLNEQLEEDSRCLEHLQQQLRDERSKRAVVEREKEVLQNQVEMLINLLHQPEQEEEEEEESMEDEEDVQQIIPS